MRYLAVMLLVLASACSPTQRIARSNNLIRAEARELVRHGEERQDAVVVDRATRIDALAGDISVDLSQVEDKTPAWISMLQWWGIALAAIAILIVLWQSGAFTAIRIAIGWLPRRKVAQAEMAVDMLDPSRPEGDREMVAAMRAQDPVFDAAFRKAQTRRKA
jgi:hypothetical protein